MIQNLIRDFVDNTQSQKHWKKFEEERRKLSDAMNNIEEAWKNDWISDEGLLHYSLLIHLNIQMDVDD